MEKVAIAVNHRAGSRESWKRSMIVVRGIRMVFSCTWNENKKNPSAEFVRARIKDLWVGCRNRRSWEGRTVRTVRNRDILARMNLEKRSLNLITTLALHQKLATLSSNSPLLNGNILTRTSPAEGMRGAQQTRNVNITVTPILTISQTPFQLLYRGPRM
eukprot:sb/3472992/